MSCTMRINYSRNNARQGGTTSSVLGCLRNLEQLLHEELVAAAARLGGGAHAEDVGLHLDGGVVREEVVAEDVAQVPPPQVVDLRGH